MCLCVFFCKIYVPGSSVFFITFSPPPSPLPPSPPSQTDEAVFECPQLFQLQNWHHVVMVINKSLRGRSKVTLFIDGIMIKTLKVRITQSDSAYKVMPNV